jgi:hypothetical protein
MPTEQIFAEARLTIAHWLAELWTGTESDRRAAEAVQGIALSSVLVGGRVTPFLGLLVFVDQKRWSGLLPRQHVPEFAGRVVTDVVDVGGFESTALWGPPRRHNRLSWPLIAGTAVGADGVNKRGTAACVVRPRPTEADPDPKARYVLTCNHVLAHSVNPQNQTLVTQPARDAISAAAGGIGFGRVESYESIVLDAHPTPAVTVAPAPNSIDIARIRVFDPDKFVPAAGGSLPRPSGEIVGLGKVRPAPKGAAPRLRFGDRVCKAGSTTGLTYGMVIVPESLEFKQRVRLADGTVAEARYRGAIGVRLRAARSLSAWARSGDSGALAVTADGHYPVGLVTTRSLRRGFVTVCPLQPYLDQHGLELVR